MSPTLHTEFAVVGAGVSGLVAARHLRARGHEVIVIEARDRVGGRTLTVPHAGRMVDVGGQWVGVGQRRVYALAAELGIETSPQYVKGRRILDLEGRGQLQHAGFMPKLALKPALDGLAAFVRIQLATYSISLERPWASLFAKRWDGLSVADWIERHARTPEIRSLLNIGTQVLFGLEPDELSLLSFLFELRSAGGLHRMSETEHGAQQDRLRGGAQQISEQLATRLDGSLHLGRPVRRIRQTASSVTLEADGLEVCAKRAILAIPPTLAKGISFDPLLPAARQRLHADSRMGSIVKVIVAYERPFWRERDLSGEAVSSTFPCRIYLDNCDDAGAHASLVGLAVGQDARKFAACSAVVRKRAVVDQLERLFGADARQCAGYLDHDWKAEVWSGGCYFASMPPGVMTAVGQALREPVGRLHFAGTETARHFAGYIDGAIEAGERAAQEVLALEHRGRDNIEGSRAQRVRA